MSTFVAMLTCTLSAFGYIPICTGRQGQGLCAIGQALLRLCANKQCSMRMHTSTKTDMSENTYLGA
jgi:hypothetical protein